MPSAWTYNGRTIGGTWCGGIITSLSSFTTRCSVCSRSTRNRVRDGRIYPRYQVSQSSVVLSFFERRPSDPPPPCQCSEDFARKHMSRKLQNGSGTPEENGGISCSTSADSSPKKPRSRTMKDIDCQDMTSSHEGSPTKAKFKTSWESPEFQKFHRLSYTIAWDCADLMGEMEDLEDGETMWEEMELGS
ncbi:SH3PXD2A [Branchiostoma lanceolatum]|uniref:SH3PXD2A protein n=1 Tax=Branchiostoma lanceolatum TaxID=7740 RepID=A0A8K0AAG4_BRALA|nr:SH3PXD2A [Branchiostoma lanceolatum]